MERLEDDVETVLGDAAAVVPTRKITSSPSRRVLEVDGCTRRRELHGICDEVRQRLRRSTGIHYQRGVDDVGLDGDAGRSRCAPRRGESVLDDLMHRHRTRLQRQAPGLEAFEVEDVVHELKEPPSVSMRGLDEMLGVVRQ